MLTVTIIFVFGTFGFLLFTVKILSALGAIMKTILVQVVLIAAEMFFMLAFLFAFAAVPWLVWTTGHIP